MRIDHLVWYNPDLAEGRRFFAEHMDCEPLYGGEHPGEGTANAVMALGPATYLEILGRDPAQSDAGLDLELKGLAGSGLYHWAAGGVDLRQVAERARKAGLVAGAPVPGGRVKPDGRRLDWTCLGLRDHPFGSLVPFFIDWMESEHPAISAPVGGRLAELEVRCPRADDLKQVFQALGLEIKVTKAAQAGIVAVLESRQAPLELHSYSPMPRGYVI